MIQRRFKILAGVSAWLGIAFWLLLCALASCPAAHAQQPTETILHSFGDGSVANDGLYPDVPLVQASDRNLYGTTASGGSAVSAKYTNDGTVFKVTPSGTVTILHSFGDGSVANDGELSEGGLIQAIDGNFYGTTAGGGSAGEGTVFRMTPSGTVTILHSFGDGSVANDGYYPQAALIQASDGNFYGTTHYGGSAGGGTVFEITPAGAETILHSFGDGSVANDGASPVAALIQASDGNFYGPTMNGGSTVPADNPNGDGTVFRMSPAGMVTILHSFGDGSVVNDGTNPVATLIQASDGNFYGTTKEGGSTVSANNTHGDGTFFRMTPSGSETILHSFGDGSVANDGYSPFAVLIQASDGNFYGTTLSGGSAGYGTLFRMTPSGTETILHSFGDGSVANDGTDPEGLIQASDGNLYGTTFYGGSGVSAGSYGDGTVYMLAIGTGNGGGGTAIDVTLPAGLQFFSLPYSYSGVGLDSLFGYTGVKLAAWNPTSGSYAVTPTAPADQIALGQGYWARFPQSVTVTLAGSAAPTTANFDIPLAQGWNMIGDPFLSAVPISGLLFANGSETFAQATSLNDPLVGPILWQYSSSANSYSAASSLSPEGGYWIYAYSATDVQVPP